jgi:hypothetical protein
MLNDSELMATLNFHEQTYSSSNGDLRVMLLCSKASILEVCGWIEQAMDLVVAESAKRCTLTPTRIAHVETNYIGKTSGFSYQLHFERMMVAVVGYRILEQAETQAGAAISAMQGALTYLTKLRNYYAHTHFHMDNPYPKNMTGIPAPTATRGYAQTAVAGLTALEQGLTNLGC